MIAANTDPLPLWQATLMLTPVAVAATAAIGSRRTPNVRAAWRWAQAATLVMLGVSLIGAIVRASGVDRSDALLRADSVGVVMLLLVSFIGWVVIRYSEAYLRGDPSEHRYIERMLMTLACVAAVVVANNLVMLVIAWSATSLVLHGLLTFFGDRPVAVAVAHKKFILARIADVAMLGAVVALGTAFDTLRIDQMAAVAAAANGLSFGASIGIVLVALAAMLKCAQLPFHGWLIQVMEAPTPVSALLHAGVVNLGGFVLLRLAPVVDRSTEARMLLVVVGAATAVLAALVMTTRISIKVSLAWSTCAQMGFMLMQCGLGLWEMAFLHLMAHSLYKAHAFLGAGGQVRQTQRKQLAAKPAPASATSVIVGVSTAIVATLAIGWAWTRLPWASAPTATLWVLGGIVALAIVPFMTASRRADTWATYAKAAIGIAGIPLAYFALHDVASSLVPKGAAPPVALLTLVAIAFVLLFTLQTVCTQAPHGAVARRLYPWFYGGLFLDEAFTRLAFAVWAPPAPCTRPAPLPQTNSRPTLLSQAVGSGSLHEPEPALTLSLTNLDRSLA